MGLGSTIQLGVARLLVKAMELPIAPRWVKYNFALPAFNRLVREGYEANSAVFSIVTAYAFALPEPPLMVYDSEGQLLPKDPLQRLLDRPNPSMDWRAFAQYLAVYTCIGGDCYIHLIRNRHGQVIEMYPYNAAQMQPVPGETSWIAEYEYKRPDGTSKPIPAEDVIPVSWPSVDPQKPWKSLSPLRAVARPVDTDNEAARYEYALLKNDAIPQTVFSLPAGAEVGDTLFKNLKAQLKEFFGGDKRGSAMVAKGDVKVTRIALNLKELGMAALRAVPEARMCAAFRIPAIVVGLNVGLEKATYSNFGEARAMWTQNTLVPLWVQIASAFERGLLEDGDGRQLRFDFSRVAALQVDKDALSKRVVEQFNSMLITQNEARAELGYAPAQAGDRFRYEIEGEASANSVAEPAKAINYGRAA